MTDPVGPQYGLEPRLDHELLVPPINSRDLISTDDYRQGGEFSGVGGLIAPPPHTPTASIS
jgi:hypothetical protein